MQGEGLGVLVRAAPKLLLSELVTWVAGSSLGWPLLGQLLGFIFTNNELFLSSSLGHEGEEQLGLH